MMADLSITVSIHVNTFQKKKKKSPKITEKTFWDTKIPSIYTDIYH